jgi:hypothetical protein
MAIAGIILFLRFPDALLNPQLFAEGGVVFFSDAYDKGPFALLTPYAGYLHLVPRLVAYFASLLDPGCVPALYNGSAFLCEMLTLAFVFSPRVRLPFKPALVLSMVLVPHTGEVINSFINIQWWLALVLIMVALSDDPGTRPQRWLDWTAILICGLTGPFIVFLLPLFVVRAWLRRSWDSIALAAFSTLIASIQIYFLIAARSDFIRNQSPDVKFLSADMGARIFGTYLRGYGLGQVSSHWGWIVVGAAFLGVAGWSVFRRGAFEFERRMLAGAFLCMALAVGLKFVRNPVPISVAIDGDRYFFLPHVLLGWLLVLAFASLQRWPRWIPVGLAAIALAANARYLHQPPMKDYAWKDRVQPIREGKGYSIPINPAGFVMTSNGRNSRR